MLELRFSTDKYTKLPSLKRRRAQLLEVFPVNHELSSDFLWYDMKIQGEATFDLDCLRKNYSGRDKHLVLLLSAWGQLFTTIRRWKPAREKQLMKARGQQVRLVFPGDIVKKERLTPFVKRFRSTDQGVVCPGFMQLNLATGCLYGCDYCYLKGTLRGQKYVNVYTNDWDQIAEQITQAGPGVYNAGELADSLATTPPLLHPAIDWFRDRKGYTLLLVTKAARSPVLGVVQGLTPSPNIIFSFSLNAVSRAVAWERGAASISERLFAARELTRLGWRVRIRLDPIIYPSDLHDYEFIAHEIKSLNPEVVTLGSMRPYGPVYNQMPEELKADLEKGPDRRWRYPEGQRAAAYWAIAGTLGRQPGLCKETTSLYARLGWGVKECNCVEAGGE
ncbi:MAG: radical SAM protein [Desulfarculaceae bacterium]|jgi:spore photoproduct lyase